MEGEFRCLLNKQGFHIAVMGATGAVGQQIGAVGQQIIQTLEKRNFPISQLTLAVFSSFSWHKIEI